ncbi:NAD-dependent epimerase/dehydratase family protein [Maridesulfovibrio salexigens]|uniref:NAD-dependent epimerase/dehydratase n=1 Tax=Maridesulfovibrio salexigens (strain ATCC 14822 / DSM 2638 / NCIMB 8403 / VKM B-1763) TaxID=526222 RepID=C6BTH1_MARSD|nr:NAD(P)-dependent oxidoreductase [Maridesulfovibrio salexigens]ACS81652.1 NAD-dependent epimerase/dehydratase [Maridesulfovibrio salexigens DSM 2638]
MSDIAVVGGRSAVAQYLLPYLISCGHNPFSMGRSACDVRCDLLGDVQISLPKNVDCVVNLAALSKVETDQDFLNVAHVNALGALKVCAASRKAEAKHVIHVSTQYVFLDHNSPYYGAYSISKRYAEELIRCYCANYSVPLTIIRFPQIYDSQGIFSVHQPLVYMMAKNAELGKSIEIYGNNDALRNYMHVYDVVKIICKVFEKKILGVYDASFPENCRLSDVAKAAQRAFGHSENVFFLSDKAEIPDTIFNTSTELYDLINYFPRINMEQGMKLLARHQQDN